MKNCNSLCKSILAILLCWAVTGLAWSQGDPGLVINDQEYFEMPGLNVMVYHDYYPVGRQGGITIIQNGIRVAANGDIRLIPTERPYPDHGPRSVDRGKNEIMVPVGYPDSTRAKYKDSRYPYPTIPSICQVKVKGEGGKLRIWVDLNEPLSSEWENRLVFRMELYPAQYFDRTYYMDQKAGIFPRQPNGPMISTASGQVLIEPLARGTKLVVLPESEEEMIAIESMGGELRLVDGRGSRNAGWFHLESTLRTGVAEKAMEWVISPSIRADYEYKPVIQVSQVGYHPKQKKVAVLEMDKRTTNPEEMNLYRISESGGMESVMKAKPSNWGSFLRYNYAHLDFTEITRPGMYKIGYQDSYSDPFLIDESVYDRHVWQPTLEYYLPVQMCHMRVNDRVKVWHGLCHEDDALMAPVSHFHFDGYKQGPSTLTNFQPADAVPGLNTGGWHDAGDYDLRVESQANTVRILAYSWELFQPEEDETTIDQERKLVEIHRPDGVPDILQQIEHGVLTINGGYKALGRLYRGIICPTGRQYSLLGDGSTMTDNLVYKKDLDTGQVELGYSGIMDDRWVFTEENPRRELFVAACLATAYRSLRDYKPDLAEETLTIASQIWESHAESGHVGLIEAAAELYLSTGDDSYLEHIIGQREQVSESMRWAAPALARVWSKIDDRKFKKAVMEDLEQYAQDRTKEMSQTPYGVRYRPRVWGDGWSIQRFGVNQYFLNRTFPDLFPADGFLNAMNFVLGVHPGINTASFVSGVGSRSLLVAYGVNRDDWSYIPGGSASGTALIRPDLPELKTWPYLWQQTEYVMGGGATNYMFLVLAAQDHFRSTSAQ